MSPPSAIGGVPESILYDRMRTAVLGEVDERGIVYNDKLLALAAHYGFVPKACRPYRAKTKGKVERPFRYIRADFFLARRFRDLDDLNGQLRQWLDTVANARVHATTQRVVHEAFAEEMAALQPLPLVPYRSVLKLERRVSHEGMVSIGGNFYSVPDATRRRVVEVQIFADEIRIVEDGSVIAVHPVLEGRHQRRVSPGHRRPMVRTAAHPPAADDPVPIQPAGAVVARRSLDFYAAVATRLAADGRSS